MSAALHLKSKELMLGNLKAQKKSDEDIKDLLARNEHDRWIAFMRSAGFCSADAETMRKYAPSSKKDRDDMSKLHVCINSWDKLPELYDGFMALEVKPDCPDFRSSDIKIVTNIQNIKNKAKTL